jgi:hypothetical protein
VYVHQGFLQAAGVYVHDLFSKMLLFFQRQKITKRTHMVTSMIFSGKKVNIFKDVGNLMQKQIHENLSFSNLT